MKKKYGVAVSIIIIAMLITFAGCSLFFSNTDTLANNGSISESKGASESKETQTTYNVSKSDLEEELNKYRAIANELNGRVESLEEIVKNAVSQTQTNIGAYASVYTDCLLNISCMESKYNVGCQGTGFIISEDGYVLTNNHVVYFETTVTETIQNGWWIQQRQTPVKGEYSSITAAFDSASSKYYANGAVYNLELIYRDPDYDLALCKLTTEPPVGEKWNAIPFYEGTVSRGDELLVLGNARGFGLSATSGLVSATGKTFEDYEKLTFIQTDAAINGGNSGGPAINIYGGLVGVVNSKFVSVIKSSYFSSEIEDVEGMGFAIELDKVLVFLSDAKAAKGTTVSYKTVSSQKAAA